MQLTNIVETAYISLYGEMTNGSQPYARRATLTSALADESRVRARIALTRGPLCVCGVTELLQPAHSTAFVDLSIL